MHLDESFQQDRAGKLLLLGGDGELALVFDGAHDSFQVCYVVVEVLREGGYPGAVVCQTSQSCRVARKDAREAREADGVRLKGLGIWGIPRSDGGTGESGRGRYERAGGTRAGRSRRRVSSLSNRFSPAATSIAASSC